MHMHKKLTELPSLLLHLNKGLVVSNIPEMCPGAGPQTQV